MRSKEGREIALRIDPNDDKGYFVIYCALTATGTYSLELYLEDELKEKRSLKYTLRQTTREKDIKGMIDFYFTQKLKLQIDLLVI